MRLCSRSLSVLSLAFCLQAQTAIAVDAKDYARAERFLSWNAGRFVINGQIETHWIGNSDHFWYQRRSGAQSEFIRVDAASGKRSTAFDHDALARALNLALARRANANDTTVSIDRSALPFDHFEFNKARSAITVAIGAQQWRCTIMAAYHCEPIPALARPGERLSPDSRFAILMREHNLWLRLTKDNAVRRLTSDGAPLFAYGVAPEASTHYVRDLRHGATPEPQGLWSPDGRYFLSHQLDERSVGETYLVQANPDDRSERPRLFRYRMALPGDVAIPQLQLVLFDLVSGRAMRIATRAQPAVTRTLFERGEAWWSGNGGLYFIERDRWARSATLRQIDLSSGVARTLLTESARTIAHTNAMTPLDRPLVRVLRDGAVVWYSQRSGYGHLYRYNAQGRLRGQITRGDWNVRSIAFVDEAAGLIYFTASGRERGRDPYEQYLYSVGLDGRGLRLLTDEPADHGWPHAALPESMAADDRERSRFSPSGKYFIDGYSTPTAPPVFVLRRASGEIVATLERGDISPLLADGYTAVEPFRALAADGRTAIYGAIHRPSTFDASRRYPVIDSLYPGPQTIRTGKSFMSANFDLFEAQSLAELGFMVVTLDGRGTPLRSRDFLEHSYGRIERASDIDDHVAVLRQLSERYLYMDLDRVGVDGASGGAFAAVHAMLQYPDFFKVGVAASGNHDQRAYLANWGEIYEGPLGPNYREASNVEEIRHLRGRLLIMHGELDDNVPPALSLRLVDTLIEANKDFDLIIMPNGDHFAFTSPYFIRRKWDFFVRALAGEEPPAHYSIAPAAN